MTVMMLDAKAPSDGELARCASTGDRRAFEALVARHYDFIHRLAYRLTGSRADAEDVAQDVCIRLAKAISAYRGGSAFTTWLYAIVMNAGRDALRKSARDAGQARAWQAQALVETQGAPAEDDPAAALWDAVRGLPDKQREAVTLVYGEGLSHAEVADIMAVSEATVSWHVHEARKRLKALLRPGRED